MFSICEHIARADGSRRLTICLDGPLPDTAQAMLGGVGGVVSDLGDQGATVTWDWGPNMAPADPVTACTQHAEAIVVQWAMRWADVDTLDLR